MADTPNLINIQYNNYFFLNYFHQPQNYFTFGRDCQGRLTPKSLEGKQLQNNPRPLGLMGTGVTPEKRAGLP